MDISQNTIQQAHLRIRERTIAIGFVSQVARTGGNNGQRSYDVVDEKSEQTFLLIEVVSLQRFFLPLNIFLNLKLFQKIPLCLRERRRKRCFLQH